MKKLTLTFILLIVSQLTKAEGNPLTIEYKYKAASDTSYCSILKSDPDFCCFFVVTASPSESNDNITLIKHTKTGVVLGTFYGRPSKKSIMEVCEKYGYLDPKVADEMALKILKSTK